MDGRFCSYSDGVCVGSRLQHASCGPCGLQGCHVQAHCSVGDQFAACHPAEAATWGFGQGCLVPVNIAQLGVSDGTECAELKKVYVLVFRSSCDNKGGASLPLAGRACWLQICCLMPRQARCEMKTVAWHPSDRDSFKNSPLQPQPG